MNFVSCVLVNHVIGSITWLFCSSLFGDLRAPLSDPRIGLRAAIDQNNCVGFEVPPPQFHHPLTHEHGCRRLRQIIPFYNLS